MKPKQIKVQNSSILFIRWEDGNESNIPLAKLRDLCPCAICLTEKLKESESYIPFYSDTQTKIEDLTIVGNYALQIKWVDGHNTGIYEYAYLKKIEKMQRPN